MLTRLFPEAPMWSRAVISGTDVIAWIGTGVVLAMVLQSARILL